MTIFLQWHCQWEQHQLIVAPSWKSALKTWWLGFDKHYCPSMCEVPKITGAWQGQMIPLPLDCTNIINQNEYEDRLARYMREKTSLAAFTFNQGPKSHWYEKYKELQQYFEKCPCDDGCEECDYTAWRLKPAFDLARHWRETNLPPALLQVKEPAKFPLWIVLKDFGHHRGGLSVVKVNGLENFRNLGINRLERINICFTGYEVSVPDSVDERLAEIKKQYEDDKAADEIKRRATYSERDRREVKEFHELMAQVNHNMPISTPHVAVDLKQRLLGMILAGSNG